MALFLKPRELEAVEWKGDNQGELAHFCGEDNVVFRLARIVFEPEKREEYQARISTPHGQVELKLGWWACRMSDGSLARMSPDFVEEYCTTSLDPATAMVRQYYHSYRANRDRLDRVVDLVEDMAYRMEEFANKPDVSSQFKLAYRSAAADLRRELEQIVCDHPERAMKYGAAEAWCSKCCRKMQPGDFQAARQELEEHIVKWCKCNTDECPVHRGQPKNELPQPLSLVPRPTLRGAMSEVSGGKPGEVVTLISPQVEEMFRERNETPD